MNSVRDTFGSPLFRDLLAAINAKAEAPASEPTEYVSRPLPDRVRPAWAVGECFQCLRFFRRGEYLRCKLCGGVICKTGNCKTMHAYMQHPHIAPVSDQPQRSTNPHQESSCNL
jgi:hypothetical protein